MVSWLGRTPKQLWEGFIAAALQGIASEQRTLVRMACGRPCWSLQDDTG